MLPVEKFCRFMILFAIFPSCLLAGFNDPAPSCLPSLTVDELGEAVPAILDIQGDFERAYTITIPVKDPLLDEQGVEPKFIVKTFGNDSQLTLRVAVKKVQKKSQQRQLEFYFDNNLPFSLKNVRLQVSDIPNFHRVYDRTTDNFSKALNPKKESIAVGGIAAGGTGHIRLVIEGPMLGNAVPLTLKLSGQKTRFQSQNSNSMALGARSHELWSVHPSFDALSIVNSEDETLLTTIALPGTEPRSLGMSADENLVFVTLARCNQILVYDRSTRTLIQRLGEAEGVGRQPEHLVVSPDGRSVYISSYVSDSLSQFRIHEHGLALSRTLTVGRRPTGLSVAPDGRRLYVAHFLPRGDVDHNEAWFSAVETSNLSVVREVASPDKGNPDQISCIKKIPIFWLDSLQDLRMEGVLTQLYGVFLDPNGNEGFIPSNVLIPFPIIEGDYSKIKIKFKQGSFSTANIQIFNFRDVAQPQPAPLESLYDIPDRNLDYLECLQPTETIEYATRYDLVDRPGLTQTTGTAYFTGNTPLAEIGQIRYLAFGPGGRTAYALGYTSDELSVFDGRSHHALSNFHFALPGSQPMGIILNPTGDKAYVNYENSPLISVLNTRTYAATAESADPAYVPYWYEKSGDFANSIPLVSSSRLIRNVSQVPARPAVELITQILLPLVDPLTPEMRRGRVLFHSSNPEKYPGLTTHRQASCQNCHPNGGTDGSVWATSEGERKTASLRGGVGKRGWLHASATYHNALEFVHYVTRERLGGKGLSDDDARSIASYITHGIPKLQHPRVTEALAETGKNLFVQYCQGCHAGEAMTSGNFDVDDPWGGGGAHEPRLFDMGTASETSGAILQHGFTKLFKGDLKTLVQELKGDRDLGPDDFAINFMAAHTRPVRARGFFKAPSLVNTWDHVLFFHSGKFTSLQEVLRYFNEHFGYGLDEQKLLALQEYLRTL